MPIWMTKCNKCGCVTPHKEDPVPDLESATIWHCLHCGSERRPQEPGSPNEPVEPIEPKYSRPRGGILLGIGG